MSGASVVSPAALAKAALRRLAQSRLEPTPENFSRAYAAEAGHDPPAARGGGEAEAPAWGVLIERLARNLERGGRQWTTARRKDSLHRVLDGCRGDPARLAQRLQSLLAAWEDDRPVDAPELRETAPSGDVPGAASIARGAAGAVEQVDGDAARAVMAPLSRALRRGLSMGDGGAGDAGAAADDAGGRRLADELGRLADELAASGLDAQRLDAIEQAALAAERWFGHRHELVAQLLGLCRELGHGLGELAEDDSWARGQCAGLQARLAEAPTVGALRAASAMLADTRERQRHLRDERRHARDSLKTLLQRMISEVGTIGAHAGGFESAVERHAAAIAAADSLEGLTEVVQVMLAESRSLAGAVQASRERLDRDHAHAADLEARVRSLEDELRRLSDEAATDALTQVANRRGLERAFATETARSARAGADGAPLAVGLIDIDNFKRLNDRLGHAAGDQALKSLAAAVRERLRPVDHVARFGGEEFVVLLPATPVDEARQTLTRLQRSLSASLFLHEGEEVFVTFSAGVTQWRAPEPLQAALERADLALYEAKRTGKNRTCQA